MTVENKTKLKQIESQSQARTNYHFWPTMNLWIQRVIYMFSQSNEQNKNQSHICFENEKAWQKPKPMRHLVSLVNLIC